MLLKKVFSALNSLSMCISGSHSSNTCFTSLKILIPNNQSVWMRKSSNGWAFTLLALDLILSIFVGPFMHQMLHYYAFVHHASLYMHCFVLFWSYFYVFVLCVKIQNHIKSEKFKKFDHICLSIFHMWVWPSTFVLMA